MATKTTAPTHTVETGHTTPTGQPAIKATCGCEICGDTVIIVRADYAEQYGLAKNTKTAHTHIHNLVRMALSPLAGAPQMRANGPWKA